MFFFYSQHPKFVIDCIILSISSAIGQLFIFYTISTFGAVVFTIMMTVRQVIEEKTIFFFI
jgi:solute carrier family 35 (adenosine 3'-phospho 5'-phosphosulfate transporter), member B2